MSGGAGTVNVASSSSIAIGGDGEAIFAASTGGVANVTSSGICL